MIFLGLDANWDKDIEVNEKKKDFFKETIKYLNNGVEYWKTNGVHTSMLKEDIYVGDRRKGGVPYHRRFSRLGFSSDYAEKICFLELLSMCTYGNSTTDTKEFEKMLNSCENKKHLETIRRILLKKNIYICISAGVEEIIDKLNFKIEANKVPIPHFSKRGITNDELEKLGKKLRTFLDKK